MNRCVRNIVSILGLGAFIALAFGSTDTSRSGGSTGAGSSGNSAPARPAAEDVRITAAGLFTSRYSRSAIAGWNVRAAAAGAGCEVLLVKIDVNMEPSMIEAMHYGGGVYGVYEGGVARFYPERTFRGVVYRDGTGKTWTYGTVLESEVASLSECH